MFRPTEKPAEGQHGCKVCGYRGLFAVVTHFDSGKRTIGYGERQELTYVPCQCPKGRKYAGGGGGDAAWAWRDRELQALLACGWDRGYETWLEHQMREWTPYSYDGILPS